MKPLNEPNEGIKLPRDATVVTPEQADKGHIVIPEGFDPVETARKKLAQVNNALYLASVSVREVLVQLERQGIEISDVNQGGMTSQAFRSLNIDSLPAEPIWDKSQPLPAQTDGTEDENSVPF